MYTTSRPGHNVFTGLPPIRHVIAGSSNGKVSTGQPAITTASEDHDQCRQMTSLLVAKLVHLPIQLKMFLECIHVQWNGCCIRFRCKKWHYRQSTKVFINIFLETVICFLVGIWSEVKADNQRTRLAGLSLLVHTNGLTPTSNRPFSNPAPHTRIYVAERFRCM